MYEGTNGEPSADDIHYEWMKMMFGGYTRVPCVNRAIGAAFWFDAVAIGRELSGEVRSVVINYELIRAAIAFSQKLENEEKPEDKYNGPTGLLVRISDWESCGTNQRGTLAAEVSVELVDGMFVVQTTRTEFVDGQDGQSTTMIEEAGYGFSGKRLTFGEHCPV